VPDDDELTAQVELVAWPAGHERRIELAAAGRPRLLVVAPGVPPPDVWESIEDWVRLPAEPADVELRRRHLALVCQVTLVGMPTADDRVAQR
jgi:hypothetical protein